MRVRKWIWFLIHIILLKNKQENIELRKEGLKLWRWVIKEQFNVKQLKPNVRIWGRLEKTWNQFSGDAPSIGDLSPGQFNWPRSLKQQQTLVAPGATTVEPSMSVEFLILSNIFSALTLDILSRQGVELTIENNFRLLWE